MSYLKELRQERDLLRTRKNEFATAVWGLAISVVFLIIAAVVIGDQRDRAKTMLSICTSTQTQLYNDMLEDLKDTKEELDTIEAKYVQCKLDR